MSGFMTRADQFKKIREKAQAKAQKSSKGTKYKNDPRIIRTTPGNTYKFRLLFWVPESGTTREEPFIRQRYHSAPNADNKWLKVICPVTHHGDAGFRMCPICENNSKLYKSGEAGNAVDEALYKNFKWKFNGYAMVYVVAAPNEEEVGKVKIFRYGIGIDKFLQKEVMGLKTHKNDPDIDPADILGFDALNQMEAGYDLIVEVVQDGDWPKYTTKFSRKATDTGVKLEDLEDEIKALNFDEFYKEETPEELEKFFNETVLQTTSDESDSEEEISDEGVEEDSDLADLVDELNDEDEDEDSSEDTSELDDEDEDDDLEDLLSELDDD